MQPELMMNPAWMILGGVVLIISVVLFVMIFVFRKAPKKVKQRAPKPMGKPQTFYYREKALISIDKINFELSRSGIDTRESYQRLSLVMRTFVSEMTGRNFTSLTLSELKQMGLGSLAALIENCYAPEFALKTQADFKQDADKAKWMVRTWS
jgi:hypothetical protein